MGEKLLKTFQDVTVSLEQALAGILFDELNISNEVREQVDLVHTQFKRAKQRSDSCDDDLFNDLMSLYNSSSSASVDVDILRWLYEKLQLVTIYDLNHESLTLHEMASGGDPSGIVEKMSTLLKEIKDFVQAEDPEMGGKSFPKGNSACPVIPDDFRCPISLDLMKDPVIVATGQTYERGKRDAATALFNLCIYQGNKGKTVRAGYYQNYSWRLKVGCCQKWISKEQGKCCCCYGASMKWGEQQQQHLAEAQEQGIVSLLEELADESGTERGKRKAVQLLERMNRFLKQQSQAQAKAMAQAHAQAQAQDHAQAHARAQAQA
ncbi:plant U-box protein [Zea mays]|uniref:Plant U-box protein n=1 Tax=Zea mays TaxID=4577 RepID=A0A1D6MKS4_MAIZE|nr:plant U-box protein [Zea mays]